MRAITTGAVVTFLFSVAAPGQTEKKLTAADAAAGDSFGFSVSINGDTAVVAAHLDNDAGTDSGSAYIFERDSGGANTWAQVKKLTASDAAAGDTFGFSVSINGDTAVVGANFDDDAGSSSGSAYVYFGSPLPIELQSFSVE